MTGARAGRDATLRLAAVALAVLFLLAHLPYLASTLEDIDSVNFALGLHDFDPARHQPHPPGYPVFMALAKVSYLLVGHDATALAVLGALFGALAAFPLLRIFLALEALDRGADEERRRLRTLCAATATLASPLFWFTASRPMSDVPGLTAALAAQAALAAAFVRQQRDPDRHDRAAIADSGRLVVLGALLAGLAIGFRAQAAWLTLPLLAVVILDRTGRGAAGALLGSAMTFSIGVLAWGVPLIVASGGWSRYAGALGAQAGEDIGGVDFLVSNPTLRHLAADLQHTFIRPWAMVPLAVLVLALAAVGAVALALRNRRALVLIASATLPYAVFHLLFQETVTVRYALPLVPAVAYLAVRGADLLSARLTRVSTIAIAAVSIATAAPALRVYATEGSPTSRAVASMSELAARGGARAPGALGMHYVFARPVKRAPPAGVALLDAPPKLEWLSLVKYWREGRRAPLWFLADPLRTDLALVDPASRKLLQRYTWSISPDRFLSGVRPDEARWLTLSPPGWFLEEGWSLTPETAGVATMRGRSIGNRPLVGYVRRRGSAATLMYGGRNLGAPGDPDVRFTVRIDGRTIDDVTAKTAPRFFLRVLALPAGALSGDGDYATLEVDAATADGSGKARAAVEQFDVQAEGAVVFGFDTGWHELEYSTVQRRLFRWSSAAAELAIHHAGRDVTLRVTGESPLRYFDAAPTVTVKAGGQELARFNPSSDFDRAIAIPAGALNASNGRVTIATDRTFVPAERSASPDKRQLGLRIYSLTVE